MEVKLLMAYIVMIYDIQPQDERPPNWIFGDSLVPSRTATIKVRRQERV